MMEFGADLRWSWVMGGLARQISPDERAHIAAGWLDHSARSSMPVDTRLWTEGPIASTYPASMAVKAAAEQTPDGGYAYLRALREGIMCLRRKLDTAEALVEEARAVGLDVERFRIDLASNAIVEAFAADLDESRDRELPSATLIAVDGTRHELGPSAPVEELREAALAAGARPADSPRPGVLEALKRFRRMAAVEVQAVCDLPEARAHAELWGLALEWRVRSHRAPTGRLWEAA
jgi:putative protein-disulfide isomerase